MLKSKQLPHKDIKLENTVNTNIMARIQHIIQSINGGINKICQNNSKATKYPTSNTVNLVTDTCCSKCK